MSAYLVTHVKVTDPQKYQAYTALTPPALQAAGGRMLARGAAEVLEGDWADGRLIVLEFPNVEAARGFYRSAAYQEAMKARDGATAFFDTAIVPGID